MNNDYLARKLALEAAKPLIHKTEEMMLNVDLGTGYVGNLKITAIYDDIREMQTNIIKAISIFDNIRIVDEESLIKAELCYTSISYASRRIALSKLYLEKELGGSINEMDKT